MSPERMEQMQKYHKYLLDAGLRLPPLPLKFKAKSKGSGKSSGKDNVE